MFLLKRGLFPTHVAISGRQAPHAKLCMESSVTVSYSAFQRSTAKHVHSSHELRPAFHASRSYCVNPWNARIQPHAGKPRRSCVSDTVCRCCKPQQIPHPRGSVFHGPILQSSTVAMDGGASSVTVNGVSCFERHYRSTCRTSGSGFHWVV